MLRVTTPIQMFTGETNNLPTYRNMNEPYDLKDITQHSSSANFNDIERITMKIDVSHTEHSHLIGKGGRNVKAMMIDTRCHIHFPDSNRTNTIEKSNQVSISGRPLDVERARKRIRQMLPLVYFFKIQNASPQALALYRSSYIVQQIESKWPVEVSYRHQYVYPLSEVLRMSSKYSLASTIVVSVRGLTAFASNVMEATRFLLDHHFGRVASQTNVWLTLEIEPKHQSFIQNHVAPRNLVELIKETTGALIRFPNDFNRSSPPIPLSPSLYDFKSSLSSLHTLQMFSSSDVMTAFNRRGFYAPRLCQTKPSPIDLQPMQLPIMPPSMGGDLLVRPDFRTLVTITGSVSGVFVARQFLMNLLPVMLISEITLEESALLERLDCSSLKTSYDVVITFRTKHRQPLKQSMIIRGTEVNTNSLFHVLNHLTSITRNRVSRNRSLLFNQIPLRMPSSSKVTEDVFCLESTADICTPETDLRLLDDQTNLNNPCSVRRRYPILGRNSARPTDTRSMSGSRSTSPGEFSQSPPKRWDERVASFLSSYKPPSTNETKPCRDLNCAMLSHSSQLEDKFFRLKLDRQVEINSVNVGQAFVVASSHSEAKYQNTLASAEHTTSRNRMPTLRDFMSPRNSIRSSSNLQDLDCTWPREEFVRPISSSISPCDTFRLSPGADHNRKHLLPELERREDEGFLNPFDNLQSQIWRDSDRLKTTTDTKNFQANEESSRSWMPEYRYFQPCADSPNKDDNFCL